MAKKYKKLNEYWNDKVREYEQSDAYKQKMQKEDEIIRQKKEMFADLKLYIQPLGSEGCAIMREGTAKERKEMITNGVSPRFAFCENLSDAEFIVHSVNYLLKKIDYWHLPWFVL